MKLGDSHFFLPAATRLKRDLLAIFKEEFPQRYEALREAVASLNATNVASEAHALKGMLSAGSVPISMTFGLLLSQEWGYQSVTELLHEVDTALYAAKAAGRNCVKLAAPKAQTDSARDLAPEPVWLRH